MDLRQVNVICTPGTTGLGLPPTIFPVILQNGRPCVFGSQISDFLHVLQIGICVSLLQDTFQYEIMHNADTGPHPLQWSDTFKFCFGVASCTKDHLFLPIMTH